MAMKKKILLFIPTYQRYEVAELCYQGVDNLIANAPDWLEIECLVIGSTPEDLHAPHVHGFFNAIACNQPLGMKKNVGVRYALKHITKVYKWDYLMELDSDGIINPALFDHYKRYFDECNEFFGCNRIAFYESSTGRALDYNLMNGGVWVTGRVISRRICEHMTLGLWHPERESGLGVNMENRIMYEMNIRVKIIHTEIPLMLDIKTGQNVSKFDDLARNQREAREVKGIEKEEILGRFGIKPISLAV
jgi:hypothetical protein